MFKIDLTLGAVAKYVYLRNLGGTITAVVLCATLVYELGGPLVTRLALMKAGEIKK